MSRFVERSFQAIQATQGGLEEENFRFHLVFLDKSQMMDFLLGLSTPARSLVQNYLVDDSEASWKELVRIINSRVIKNPKFQNSYGVFFPHVTWLALNPQAVPQRLVRTNLPAGYRMVPVPKLSLYLARTGTSDINRVTLTQALPEYGSSLGFSPETGIQILESMLELFAAAQEEIAASA
jgi:hypothetical protein